MLLLCLFLTAKFASSSSIWELQWLYTNRYFHNVDLFSRKQRRIGDKAG